MKTLVLLDLNKTLAKECVWNWKTSTYYPQKDVYCKKLAKELSSDKYDVILITARLESYKTETLKKINKDVNLKFIHTEFKKDKNRGVKVHFFKANFYKEHKDFFTKKYDRIISVESNSNTKTEYKKLGIFENYTRDNFLNKVNEEKSKTETRQGLLF
jgi:hypothetical protein